MGLYARLVENAADVAAADIQFGHFRLDLDILLAAEASLSSEFDSSPCGVGDFVRRIEVDAARPDRTTVTAYARHYVPLEPFLLGDNLDDIWVSHLEAATLVDDSDRLAPYADSVFLVGPRFLRLTRLLSTPPQYSLAMFRLVNAVCLSDGGIVMPAARLAILGVPVVPAIADDDGRLVRLRCLVYWRRRFRRRFLTTTFASASEIGWVCSRFRLNCSSCLCQIAMFG